jgi:heptosyltransferase-2
MKILFIKLGGIGDVIQAAAAMNEYRSRSNDIHVEWVIGKVAGSLLEHMNVADTIHVINDQELVKGSLFSRGLALAKTAFFLSQQGKFDQVFIGYNDWRYRLLPGLVKTRKTNYFSNTSARPSPLQHRNRVFEYLRLFQSEEIRNFDIATAMSRLGDNMDKSIDGLPYHVPRDYVVLVPGGARNLISDDALRRWPLEYYLHLAEKLICNGIEVVLAGGKEDQWVTEYFKNLPVHNLIGRTSLPELWKLMNQSNLVVSHDTGPLHMALTGKAGVIGIFGPTPLSAIIPSGRENTVPLHAMPEVACAPCYSGKNYAPCNRPLCMESIIPELVFETAINLLARGNKQSV